MESFFSKSLDYLKSEFSFDLRALALMRIGIASLLLLDLSIRAEALEAHYTNMGVVPLPMLFNHAWNQYHFSLHTVSGLWIVQAVLFLIAAFFALCLLLGVKTRLATLLSWIMLISIQNRNPFILQGGDDLLRMLLFWGLFLPWNRRYAFDAMNEHAPQTDHKYFSAACLAYIVQVASVYVVSAFLKNSPEWHTEGTALYYALSLDQMTLPVGRLIYPYPGLLKFLTLSTYYIELLLPLVLFIPFRSAALRMIFIVVLTGFHIGIAFTLYVGLFFIINIVSFLGMLPSGVMDWIEKRWAQQIALTGKKMMLLRTWWTERVTLNLGLTVKKPLMSRDMQLMLREGTVAMALAYGCLWNMGCITSTGVAENLRWVGYVFRLDQHWGMFAPSVFKDDGWYVLEGSTDKDKLIDLNREGNGVDYIKPASVVSMFSSDRWRKYSENYLFVKKSFIRPYYCNYMLRKWNETHQEKIRELKVVYMKEVSQPDYKPVTPLRQVLCRCGTK